MVKDDYLAWLLNWFQKRVDMPADAATRNFFAEQWIDSFKTLELITEIESTFNIQFSDASFNDARFPTIHGLSELILEIKGTN